MAGLASAWAMARRRPEKYRQKVDAATRWSGVRPHTCPDSTVIFDKLQKICWNVTTDCVYPSFIQLLFTVNNGVSSVTTQSPDSMDLCDNQWHDILAEMTYSILTLQVAPASINHYNSISMKITNLEKFSIKIRILKNSKTVAKVNKYPGNNYKPCDFLLYFCQNCI